VLPEAKKKAADQAKSRGQNKPNHGLN
ncbi:hypothetical protein CCACVL1_27840, partial [Corchorus capsularis]